MLYQFEQLKRKLDQLGYPKIQSGSGFEIIKDIDFKNAYQSGDINLSEKDGIYYKNQRGYTFIKEAWITRYDRYPKFHLIKCEKIQEFISDRKYEQRYVWSNSNVNDLIDITTGNRYKNQNLSLCGFCRKELTQSDIKEDTEEFFKSLDKRESETDIFGYSKDQEKISKLYRKEQNYTCESCGVQCKDGKSLHKKWWHLHHIDGNKTNNEKSNFACLCICCHSERHKENFSTPSQKIDIESFVKEYKAELTKLDPSGGNLYFLVKEYKAELTKLDSPCV